MSASISTFRSSAAAVEAPERETSDTRHERLLGWILLVFVGAVIALLFYGADYYRLSQTARAFSPKHHLLKPGGVVGINLGVLGVVMLCGIFLYPLRRRWRWLQEQGNSKRWLDRHIVLGVAAPVCIALHSSFKFRGLAGLAFWVMVAVSVSGLVGRYLYAQVLQDIADAELLLRTLQAGLERQSIVPQADLRRLVPPLPDPGRVSRWSLLMALIYMLASDLARPLQILRIRAKIRASESATGLIWGIRAPRNAALEQVIRMARKQALLSRRILFLSHAKKAFQLWHVVHKPFSYAFAVLALLHIAVVMLLGFL
jgi:hypothetical protein